VAEGEGRALRVAPAARAESRVPLCGQGWLPPHKACFPSSFPPPLALPRATAPTAGGAKRTYLEPDKQEPLRHGSQSPPRVTGAATANRSRCHKSLRPIPLRSGLRASSIPQPMGKSGRRSLPPGAHLPSPLHYHLPGGGARSSDPGRERRGSSLWPGGRERRGVRGRGKRRHETAAATLCARSSARAGPSPLW
jgi:hypothetical protein